MNLVKAGKYTINLDMVAYWWETPDREVRIYFVRQPVFPTLVLNQSDASEFFRNVALLGKA